MLAGQFALAIAALFSGAALYVNIAEHPARRSLDDAAQLIEWQPAYKRGMFMQASLAILGFVAGIIAWWQTEGALWLAGAIILVANWPYTLIVIAPTNRRLIAAAPDEAGPATRALLELWARLHAVRTVLGFAATILFLAASLR